MSQKKITWPIRVFAEYAHEENLENAYLTTVSNFIRESLDFLYTSQAFNFLICKSWTRAVIPIIISFGSFRYPIRTYQGRFF